MKVLLAGDSFAADWSVKYPTRIGWPNLLANIHDVTNLAQAGISEFRILQQLQSVDLDLFDVIVVAHTSPHRVVTKRHPVHADDLLYENADLIFSDIEYHKNSWRFWLDPAVSSAYGYFLYHQDTAFADWVYYTVVDQINTICNRRVLISIASPLVPDRVRIGDHTISIEPEHMIVGAVNHLSAEGNQDVFEKIIERIEHAQRT